MKETKKIYVKLNGSHDACFTLEIKTDKKGNKTGKLTCPYIDYRSLKENEISENVYDLSGEKLECIEKQYFDKNVVAIYLKGHPFGVVMEDFIHHAISEKEYKQIINGTYKLAGIIIPPSATVLSSNKNAREAFNRGLEYFNNKDNDNAINEFTRVIKFDPDYAEVYNFRALAFCEKKLYNEAIKDFSEAIKINPYYLYYYVRRGICYDNNDQFEKAIKDFSKAIRLNPEDSSFYKNRGNIYKKSGQNDEAANDYEMAKKIDADNKLKAKELEDLLDLPQIE